MCTLDLSAYVAPATGIAYLTGASLARSRPVETSKMAASNSSTSSTAVMAASKYRVHFGITLDLELLAYVKSLNPFVDSVQWTVIAAKMQEITGMPFNTRNVRN
ncbi:hypothetical protein MTO96_023763 [Rhipicephalus appendiculatus]